MESVSQCIADFGESKNRSVLPQPHCDTVCVQQQIRQFGAIEYEGRRYQMIALFLFGLLGLTMASPADGTLDEAVSNYEKGEYQKSIELLHTVRDTEDVSPDIYLWLAKSYLKVREWDKAVQSMEKAVELSPSDAMYHLWLGRAYGERADNRIWGLGDAKRLLREFIKAREISPDSIDIRFDLLEFYAQAPGIVGGSENKAWDEAKAITKLNPVIGYTARATIYERKEKWDLAEDEYKKAVKEYPENANAHKDLAQFLFSRENYKDALEAIQKSLELNSQSKQSRFLESACRIQLGVDLDKAGETLKELTKNPLRDDDPAREDLYYWQGVLYHKDGNREESKKALEKALQINPEHQMAKKYLKKHF